jgi:hypothetical protein
MDYVIFNNKKIEYTLTRKNVKNINLRIHPDLSISVSANKYVPKRVIEEFILSKGEFITNSLEKLEKSQKKLEQSFCDNSTFDFFERSITVCITKADKPKICLQGDKLLVFAKDTQNQQLINKQIEKWIAQQSLPYFEKYFNKYKNIFSQYKIPNPTLTIRKMKSKWGSCQYQTGKITINSQLFRYPEICLDYVMLHEFCHFLQPNHSKEFYALVESFMPNWKIAKNILK